jgi:uncharacterized protein YnzC (UPF0291/DUF896 family)
MIKWEIKDVKKYNSDLAKIEKLRKQYFSFYKAKQKTHVNLIKTISRTYVEQMKLDCMAMQCNHFPVCVFLNFLSRGELNEDQGRSGADQ